MQKNTFFERNFIQKVLFWNFKIYLIDVYQYHIPQKIHPIILLTTLVLKYIYNFKFCDEYYFVGNIFHTFEFFNVYWIFQNT
jgi:hypothetical protein